VDDLKEKLCHRFEAVSEPAVWRALAFCLGQLGHSEKGLRGVMELAKSYRHAMGEQDVFAVFMVGLGGGLR
jgi:condensin complex subunit 1